MMCRQAQHIKEVVDKCVLDGLVSTAAASLQQKADDGKEEEQVWT
jgi:hypothetical protein